MKKIVLFFAFINFSLATPYTLEQLKDKNNSIAKDYYIYRLMENNKLDKKDAKKLKEHIFRYVGKMKMAFEKIIPPKKYINPQFVKCYKYNQFNILDANLTCQNLRASSVNFLLTLGTKTKDKLINNLKKYNKTTTNLIKAFNDKNPSFYIVKNQDVDNFLKVYKYKNFDENLSKKFVNKLILNKQFQNFAIDLITTRENIKFRYSLLDVDANLTKDNTAFYLGINAITFNEDKKAFEFFNQAYNTFSYKLNKDNALFWMYLISNNEKYLNLLANSDNINIYSIYARELLNLDFFDLVKIKEPQDKSNDFNMQDPFAWQSLARYINKLNKQELINLSNKFYTKDTLPIYSYILERINNSKKQYYIMPYYEHLQDYDTNKQALIFAIARQESRFIPTAISTSYALGMMQLMPFLANHIGNKELKIENFDQDDMFKPYMAYKFANFHLDYLQTYLNSPLYVFYAYNGGIGFTRRMLAKEHMFKDGKYEPFLSMELVPYAESRNYGKKVLANYIVYRYLLNDSIKISSIFENLNQNKEISQNTH